VTGIRGNADVDDRRGHGTHVAGIIAANPEGNGIRGVLEQVELIPVKVVKEEKGSPVRPQDDLDPPDSADEYLRKHYKAASGFVDGVARGMLYAIKAGAQVINLSMAWPAAVDSKFMREMVALAIRRGIIVVASAGNEGTEARVFPCAYPGVVCVGAHGPDGGPSHFSNWGSSVEVSAPGLAITSLYPEWLGSSTFTVPGIESKNGTSMASPMVAGALGRILQSGADAREAVGRLYAGTRAAFPASIVNPLAEEKFSQFGNADLALALSAVPEPLIAPFHKELVRIGWDRKATELKSKLLLKNFWAEAKESISLEIAVLDQSDKVVPVESVFTIPGGLGAGALAEIPVGFRVLKPRELDNMIWISVKVRVGAKPERTYRVPFEVAVLVTPAFVADQARVYKVLGLPPGPKGVLRSVTRLDGPGPQEYLQFQIAGPPDECGIIEMRMDLLSQGDQPADSRKDYTRVASTTTKIDQGAVVYVVYRTDLNFDGSPDYLVVSRVVEEPDTDDEDEDGAEAKTPAPETPAEPEPDCAFSVLRMCQ
jgi:hypothetical protein